MLKGDGAVIGATYGLLVRAKHFRKRSKDGKTESETDTDGVLGLPCAPPGSFHSLKSLMFMETRRSAEATREWQGPRKKSHDLKDLPLLTHLHRSHQPYLNWLLKCGLFLFFNGFGFFLRVCSHSKAAIFLNDFSNVDICSLNGPWQREGERIRLPLMLIHISTHVYTYVYTQHKSREDEGSVCCWKVQGLYTSPGWTWMQWIQATYTCACALSISFHLTLWHTHIHKPSLSSGPHWLSSKCLGASGIQLAFGAGLRHHLTLRNSSYSTPFCLGGWKNKH